MPIFKRKKPEYNIPEHIAFIMDGNGRWAKKRGMPRTVGHFQGAKVFKSISKYCADIGVKVTTFYAFSTENWKRPKEEIDEIMRLFGEYLDDTIQNFKDDNRKLNFIGNREPLSDELKAKMSKAEELCKDRTGMKVNVAINYGGREEITTAVKQIANECKNSLISIDEITQDYISNKLYTSSDKDPDLIIRPSGEIRLSNFLLWQSAYSEFWFDNILWPDFTNKDLDRAIIDYNKRNRRYGNVK